MSSKKAVRSAFRNSCLSRDKYKCRVCNKQGYNRQGTAVSGKVPLDVHHITERNCDNYVLANGISVCDDCHLKAEQFHISNGERWEPGFHPNDLYKLINSSWRI